MRHMNQFMQGRLTDALLPAQVVAYTIMDIISKCVFTFMIVSAHDALGPVNQAPAQKSEYV